MRWFKYCKFLMVCCLIAVFSGCEEDDDYRGYMLSGRWFVDLGMMVDGQPAIGSDLEFIPQDYGGYTRGYGYETDYYHGWRGRVEIVEHYFTWMVRDGIIYLRFDNPELDCNIRDYSLSPDYFKGYMDGVYSSTWFTLRNYERYWNDYGYWSAGYSYGNGADVRSDSVQVYKKVPKCVRTVNVDSLMQGNK